MMSRVERKMYARARGQATLRRAIYALTALVVALGLIGRFRLDDGLTAKPLERPTATPVTMGFDETVVTRELSLDSLTWYGLQTGIFSTREAAEAKAGSYADRGAPGYVYQDGEKFRVLIACYENEADAAAVRDRLAEVQDVDVHLHRWTLPSLTLRLSGMAGQLDVAEAGMQLLRQTALLLRDEAIAIDRSERSLETSCATLSHMDEQMRLWRQTARQRFGKPYPAMIDGQLAIADSWDTYYSAMKAADSLTGLSASMKIHAMTLYTQLAQLHDMLNSP